MQEDARREEKRGLLNLTGAEVASIQKMIVENPLVLLRIPEVCELLANSRTARTSAAPIRKFEGDDRHLQDGAIDHNIAGFTQNWSVNRPWAFLSQLYGIEELMEGRGAKRVLSIGPRSLFEVFSLCGIGFRPENISALDLFASDPFVDLGDMHAMPYGDSTFDLVTAGFVLAYSRTPEAAVAEILRVIKPGGFVVVGCEHSVLSRDESRQRISGQQTALNTDEGASYWPSSRIHGLFGDRLKRVIFNYDNSDEETDCGVLTCIQVK